MTRGGLRPWLRLVREPLAPTAAFDAVACAAMGLGASGLAPTTWPVGRWAALAGTSLLLYAAGMAANDLADRDRDRVLAPDRPLPSGDVTPRAAAALVVLLAGLAVLVGGGTAPGRLAAIAAVVLAGIYDFAAKHRLLPGAVAMGGVRLANASLGLAPLLADGLLPGWALLGPFCIGLYSAAVVVLSTTEEAPSPRREVAARVMAAAAFGVAAAVALLAGAPGIGAILGATLAVGVALSTLAGRTPRPGRLPKLRVLEMLLGLYVLSWVVGTGAAGGSLLVALLALAAALGLNVWSQVRMRSLRRRPR